MCAVFRQSHYWSCFSFVCCVYSCQWSCINFFQSKCAAFATGKSFHCFYISVLYAVSLCHCSSPVFPFVVALLLLSWVLCFPLSLLFCYCPGCCVFLCHCSSVSVVCAVSFCHCSSVSVLCCVSLSVLLYFGPVCRVSLCDCSATSVHPLPLPSVSVLCAASSPLLFYFSPVCCVSLCHWLDVEQNRSRTNLQTREQCLRRQNPWRKKWVPCTQDAVWKWNDAVILKVHFKYTHVQKTQTHINVLATVPVSYTHLTLPTSDGV